jgi:uncharacterized protein (DUF1800 family)
MTWFWMNHFSVHQGKANLRAMVGDYEENAIRPHALGKFRDLLSATLHHPAMIRYLDNEQNAANRINENYAREIMELHTLGVDGGYTQNDVQQLARILTGVGVNLGDKTPNVRKDKQDQYVRKGLFEFNPNRHDYADKVFLGQTVKGRGLAEVDERWTACAAIPPPRATSAASWPSISSPTNRRRSWWNAWPRASSPATAISPPCCA